MLQKLHSEDYLSEHARCKLHEAMNRLEVVSVWQVVSSPGGAAENPVAG